METKPIKRSEHILKLSKDHHFSLLFCWKIRQGLKRGVNPGRIKNYVLYFQDTHMRVHFREEEEVLFGHIRHEAVERAREDHRIITSLIDSLEGMEEERMKEELARLADLVDAHVRFEERELFPHLEKTLTLAQLEDIGRQLHETPPAKDCYEDEFWAAKGL